MKIHIKKYIKQVEPTREMKSQEYYLRSLLQSNVSQTLFNKKREGEHRIPIISRR